MSRTIESYVPDLDKIAEYSKNPEPVIVTKEEFEEVIAKPEKHGLYRGANMSDEEILRAMEIGWIKVWDTAGEFNLLKAIQGGGIDFSLGPDFWHYRQAAISRLTIGEHIEPIRNFGLLEYTYKLPNEEFVFYPNTIVLALTNEGVSLSNALYGQFDGRSLAARLGLSIHQTAGRFDAGFSGKAAIEMSNVNPMHLGVRVNDGVGSMTFHMYGSPSTRPRTQKIDSESMSQNQTAPFGFWDSKWDEVRKETERQAAALALEINLRVQAQYNMRKRAF